jgi:beta-glucosidase
MVRAIAILALLVPAAALLANQESSPADKARKIMKKMTLTEKAAQMLQIEGVDAVAADVLLPFVGSVLYEGNQEIKKNEKRDWFEYNNEMQKHAKRGPHSIPMLIGADSVHGQSHVKGTTVFPHNIALGCSRNATLVEQVGKIAAKESAATGVNFIFAPCLDIVEDIRWGRTYESFGQDPQIVNELGSAFVAGAKNSGTGMITSVKHFVAAGATEYGTGRNIVPQTKIVEYFEKDKVQALKVHERKLMETDGKLPQINTPLDRGNAKLNQQQLFSKHMLPYWGAVRAGTHSVMTSYSSVNDVLMHKNKELLQYLKGESFGGMNFEGFVITDYAGIDMIDKNYKVALPMAINAGIDMVMLPGTKYACRPWSDADKCPTAHDYLTEMIKQVQAGHISEDRIDDAVFRILKAKIESGVYDSPIPDKSWLMDVGSDKHREIARQAVQQSVVLLQNKDEVLPLKHNAKICIAGRGGNDLGYQLGGWSVKWQGQDPDTPEKDINKFTKGTTIWQDVHNRFPGSAYDKTGVCKGYDTVLAVVSEPPYAEGYGDRTHLRMHHADVEMVKNAKEGDRKVVLIAMTGRPLWIDDALPTVDAAVAAFLPGTEGGHGIMDVLSGEVEPTGKLSVAWPKHYAKLPVTESSQADEILFPSGFGLSFSGREL